jgi:hypothetical protein
MLLTAYTLGLDKKLLRQGFQNAEQPQASKEEEMVAIKIMTMIMEVVAGISAAYLSYTLNKHLGTSTGWMFFYMVIAAMFPVLYLFAYSFFYNPLLKGGASKSRSPASASRRNTNA